MTFDPREFLLFRARELKLGIQGPDSCLELLATWQEMRRLSPLPAPDWERAIKDLGGLAQDLPYGPSRIFSAVNTRQWVVRHEKLVNRGLRSDWLRLLTATKAFRQADQWRLALHGARCAGIEDPLVEDLWEEVEIEVVDRILEDAWLYAGVYAFFMEALEITRPGLEDEDPVLFSTLDIHVAVDAAWDRGEDE